MKTMELLDQYEAACQVRRLAPRTIPTYRRWVEEFLRFIMIALADGFIHRGWVSRRLRRF
jgi:hypothetical protein